MINPFNMTMLSNAAGPLALGKEEEEVPGIPKPPLASPKMLLSDAELQSKAIPNTQVLSDDRYFSGDKAVKEVEKRLGRELEPRFKHIVREEGFFAGRYMDDREKNPVETGGVGQTGEYLNMPLSQVFKRQESDLSNMIPSYNDQPEEVKAALLSAKYRGDMKPKFKWVKHFNAGNYEDAAKELLDHKEYRSRKSKDPNDGVVKRLDHISETIRGIK